MIQLTRLNKEVLVVNSDLIKLVEAAPDTVLTLITGEKLIVRESLEEVLNRIIAFRQAILSGLSHNLTEQLTVHRPSSAAIGSSEEGK